MLKYGIASLLSLAAMMWTAAPAQASCFTFKNTPSDLAVCVGKKGKNDVASQDAAKFICKKAHGSDCGAILGYSPSCTSNSKRCYDESGQASGSLTGY